MSLTMLNNNRVAIFVGIITASLAGAVGFAIARFILREMGAL